MKTAARPRPEPSRRGGSSDTPVVRLAHLLAMLGSEYRRALAAERRYQELRHTNALTVADTRTTSAGLPQRLFAEMYSRPPHER
jgi:hypothetical protein